MSRAMTKQCANCGTAFVKDPRYSKRYFSRQTYCSQRCAGAAWKFKADATRKSLREHFDSKVIKGPGCWGMAGMKDKDGYSMLSYRHRQYRASVLALELDGRPVPKGMYACHHCDNPCCVNPAHLYVGTPQNNVDDKMRRGRQPHGADIHAAKLTDADVLAIRAGSGTTRQIADKFGCTPSNISMIRARRTWKHLP